MKSNLLKIFFFIFIFSSGIYYFKFKKKYYYESISILSWSDSIDMESINEFEKKEKIKINITYYTTNEELISKMILSGNTFDIVIPSDYAAKVLIQKGFLKKLDKSKININFDFDQKIIDKQLYEKDCYIIPLEWIVYGIIIKNKYLKNFSEEDEILKYFFEGKKDKQKFRLCMINDMLAAYNTAYLYYKKYYPKNNIETENDLFNIIHEILKKQKQNIVLYTDERIPYLFETDSVDIAYCQSNQYFKCLEKGLDVSFIIPSYAIIKSVEYLAISESAKNEDAIYKFVNFILNKSKNFNFLNKSGSFSDFYFEKKDEAENNQKFKFIKKIINKVLTDNDVYDIQEIFSKDNNSKLWMILKS